MFFKDKQSYLDEVAPDQLAAAKQLFKAFFKNPKLFWRSRCKHEDLQEYLDEYAYKVSFDRTDHPLDAMGPFEGVVAVLPKLYQRRTQSIRTIALLKQNGAEFIFLAKGYNIFTKDNVLDFTDGNYPAQSSAQATDIYIAITLLRDDVYRMRMAKTVEEVREDRQTAMVVGDLRDPQCSVTQEETDVFYLLKTRKLSLRIFKQDFSIDVLDGTNRLITRTGRRSNNEFRLATDSYPMGYATDKRFKTWFAMDSFDLAHDEAIYGLGEQFGRINKVGQTIRLWIHEGIGNLSGRVYKAVPLFLSTRGYGVFYNHSEPTTFWIGSKEKSKIQVAVESQSIDCFVFIGSIKSILDHYTTLTGKAAMPPRYSFGTWLTRMSYTDQDQVMEVARVAREKKFPSDVVHVDITWFEDSWRCDWRFSPTRFSNPGEMIEQLQQQGFKFTVWQCPYVLKGTWAWDEAKRHGYLAASPKAPFIFVGAFEALPIDFTNPDACRWYRERLLKPLFELGVAAIKTDFGEGIHPGMQFKEGDGKAIHNLYPLLYNREAYTAAREYYGDEGAMVWGRSAYSGSQRYPVVWSGDNSATFGSMAGSLNGGLNLGLSGFTFWSQDTGGFTGEPTDELMVRWTQLSIFQSHIRYHGTYPFREPWLFGEKAQAIMRDFLNFRYQLIPYLMSESRQAIAQGLPILRALVLEYQDDPNTYHISDQFLCGANLLVAPVMSSEGRRRVYLPKGNHWYDYWSGQAHEGGQWLTVDSALESIPLYARAGSILPLARPVQSTQDLTLDNLTLCAFGDHSQQSRYTLLTETGAKVFEADHRNQTIKTAFPVEQVIWRNLN